MEDPAAKKNQDKKTNQGKDEGDGKVLNDFASKRSGPRHRKSRRRRKKILSQIRRAHTRNLMPTGGRPGEGKKEKSRRGEGKALDICRPKSA